MTRHINAAGKKLVKSWEDVILFAYDDADPPNKRRKIRQGDEVRGTLTIGYGHTGPDVTPGLTITEVQADMLLDADLAGAERAVENEVTVPLSDNQFAALVSFAFNAGLGAFASSTLLKRLNRGQYAAVPVELAKWNKTTIAGQKVISNGLVNRRAAEVGLWGSADLTEIASASVSPSKAPDGISFGEVAGSVGTLGGPAAAVVGAAASGNGQFQMYAGIALVIAVLLVSAIVIRKVFFAK